MGTVPKESQRQSARKSKTQKLTSAHQQMRRDSEREPFYDDKTPSTGCGSECVPRCTSVYTTWHLDTCRHSANLCPAFLVAVTYAQLVVVNWTSPVLIVHVRGTGVCLRRSYTSWNSLPDNLKNVNLSLQSFKRHLKTFFFSSY